MVPCLFFDNALGGFPAESPDTCLTGTLLLSSHPRGILGGSFVESPTVLRFVSQRLLDDLQTFSRSFPVVRGWFSGGSLTALR